jgi:FdhD protein
MMVSSVYSYENKPDAGAVPAAWHEFRQGWKRVESEVVEEAMVSLYVNGMEMATIMCTPREQDLLALGFIKSEGFIESIEDVDHVHISAHGCCVDVWLNHPVEKPERLIITSGCGGGVTFEDPSSDLKPLESEMQISLDKLIEVFNQLHYPGSLHMRARGVHAAGLSDGEHLLVVSEDVGRHNTIDKLLGACMRSGIETKGRILLVTGRVSSEMLRKGALMGCPVIASRNSPTSMSVAMADAWNITLIGYARRDSIRVYTHRERVGNDAPIAVTMPGNQKSGVEPNTAG